MPEKGTIGHGKAANSIYKSRTGSNRTGSNREALETITPVPPDLTQKKTLTPMMVVMGSDYTPSPRVNRPRHHELHDATNT